MGVTGLWRLIEPAGKPVPIETLENKVLAVDISLWLHQMVKGWQDARGAPMPNAHLLGLFQRLCKLLYFRIKPVFVFDGGFPDLKKETIAKRQDSKAKLNSESERLKREILLRLGQKTAIGSLLGTSTSPKKATRDAPGDDDLFKLPEIEKIEDSEESESEEETSIPALDLHSVDLESENFKNLSVKEKYDVLIELKETRKMNSWGKLHELPKDSDDFSDFQMKRLLKRRKVQECIEETEKEFGGQTMTLSELESLLTEDGVIKNMENLPTKRIAKDDTTRYLLISNVKQALAEAKKREIENEKAAASTSKAVETKLEQYSKDDGQRKHDALDDDLQKAIQMSLECVDEEKEGTEKKESNSQNSSSVLDSDFSDTSEEIDMNFDFNNAKAYIMQNTDFTSDAIAEIVSKKPRKNKSNSVNKVKVILKELNMDVTASSHTLDDSSSEDELETTLDLSSSDDGDDFIEVSCADNLLVESINIGTKEDSIVNLDSTVENMEGDVVAQDNDKVQESSDTDDDDDDDFEEVPNETSTVTKSVVELNLEMKGPLEDDIFADVFECTPSKLDEKPSQEHKNVPVDEIKVWGEVQSVDVKIAKSDDDFKTLIKQSTVKVSKISEAKPYEVDDVKRPNEVPKETTTEEEKHALDAVSSTSKEETSTEVAEPQSLPLNTEKLSAMAEQLETETDVLMQEKSRLERMGRNITEQMTRDTQELLRIFGIPYIVAPCEAEAQCAFLETVGLTHGTITDDSDIWLFGGRTVYKNFFNQKKLVLQFLADRIDKSFNLSRPQLILLALLVGSDYTQGLTGVGPVTALEILAAFCRTRQKSNRPEESRRDPTYSELLAGLQEFKKWVRTGKRTDDSSLRRKLKNVAVGDDFPSARVVQAYMEPKIDRSEEKFTWGRPDITVLSDYARTKFGWSRNKFDEILTPVLKRMAGNEQKTIKDYFRRKVEFASLADQMSKRVKAAVAKMSGNDMAELAPPAKRKPAVKKNKNTVEEIAGPSEIPVIEEGDSDTNISNNTEHVQSGEGKRKTKKKGSVKPKSGLSTISKAEDNTVVVSSFDISVPKLDRYQEIIPQREQDRATMLKNKMKAIEAFTKTKLEIPIIEEGDAGTNDVDDAKNTKPVQSRKGKRKMKKRGSVEPKAGLTIPKAEDNAVVVSSFGISVPKLDRYQEIIPQREQERATMLKNKMKAIETFRKTKLDKKSAKKKKPNIPKPNAELSESSESS